MIMPSGKKTFIKCFLPNCGIFKQPSEASTTSWWTPLTSLPIGSKQTYENAEGWKNFTNIVEIDPSDVQTITLDKGINAPVYDLNGRKLKELSKGINIIGRKKVVMK